jgi:putative ABC transport system permease protein
MGVVVFVLLIACANVAGIFLARYAGREIEFAVRAALGARRSRLIQQLLGESLLLALLGGGFGLLLSLWGVHLLRAKLSFNAERAWLAGKVQVDSKVFLFTCVISLLTVLLFGVLPALKSAKLEIQAGLHGGGSAPSQGRRESRLRSGFVVGQIALTVILIAAAGASIQLVIREMRARLGFDPKGVLSVDLSLPGSKYHTIDSQAAFFSEIVQRIQGLAGVQFAAVTQEIPESFPPEERPQAGGYFVSPYYFQVMKIPLLRGRAFSSSDSARSPRVTIVNETFVRQYFPNADPIGGFIRTYGNPLSPPVSRQIVGVVADVIDRVGQRENVTQIYVPFVQDPMNTMKLVIRVNGDPTALTAAVRDSIWAIDKDQPIGDIKMMTQVIGAKGANDRFLGWMLDGFASTALGLATIGIFGVVAYTVAQRTHEIGVRMALGAQKGNVFRLIVGRGIFLATVGTALGFIGAVLVVRILASAAYSDSWFSALLILFIAPAGVMLAALLASYIPARRAMRVDPMVALRYE